MKIKARILLITSFIIIFTAYGQDKKDNDRTMIVIPKHNEEWESYFAQVDYKLSSILVDLGLREVAPIKSLDIVGWINLRMNNPREDGLSSQEEFETLVHIENVLVKNLIQKNNSVFVGRNTSDRSREFYFYISDTIIWEKQVTETMAQFPKYQYDYGHKPDVYWEGYFDYLYPKPQQMQCITNRRVIESLEENGDKLSKEREVYHWIYFKTVDDREKYSEKVKELGFKIEDMSSESGDEFPFKLRISRVDKVDYNNVDEYVLYLWELAKQCNGDYDGWETSVEKE